MSIGTNISIAQAKRLSTYHELDGAVLLAFKDGHFKVASYGVTPAFCRLRGRVVEKASDLVEAVGDELLEVVERKA